MNKLDAFENIVRESLSNYEAPADASAWSDMNARLDQMGSTPSSGFSGLRIFGGAAVVAGLAVGGYFMLQTDSTETSIRQLTDVHSIEYKTDSESLSFNLQNHTNTSNEVDQNLTPIDPAPNHNQHQLNNPNNANPVVVNQVGPDNGEPNNNETIIDPTDPTHVENPNTIDNNPVVDNNPESSNEALPLPAANFTISNNEVCAGTALNFTPENGSYDGIYLWSFGDGVSAKKSLTNHTYHAPGDYIVSLTITDNNGKSVSSDQSIRVLASPKPDFSYSITTNNLIPEVIFNNQTDQAQNYEWDFNDGTDSERAAPEHTFQRKGNYRVSLKATNSYGCSNETTKVVSVVHSYNLLAPTGFTPDGDNLNPNWIPEALKVLDVTFTLTVLDQNGKAVFQTNDINNPWDGRDLNGNIQNGKTFVWICILKNEYGEEEAYKGTVTIATVE